jgi:hypothetical protein
MRARIDRSNASRGDLKAAAPFGQNFQFKPTLPTQSVSFTFLE